MREFTRKFGHHAVMLKMSGFKFPKLYSQRTRGWVIEVRAKNNVFIIPNNVYHLLEIKDV